MGWVIAPPHALGLGACTSCLVLMCGCLYSCLLLQVCFDRGGFRYHGRVEALADAAREAGLNF